MNLTFTAFEKRGSGNHERGLWHFACFLEPLWKRPAPDMFRVGSLDFLTQPLYIARRTEEWRRKNSEGHYRIYSKTRRQVWQKIRKARQRFELTKHWTHRRALGNVESKTQNPVLRQAHTLPGEEVYRNGIQTTLQSYNFRPICEPKQNPYRICWMIVRGKGSHPFF